MGASDTTGRNEAYANQQPSYQPSNQGVPGSRTRIVVGGAGNSGVNFNPNGTIIAPGSSRAVMDYNSFNAAAPNFTGSGSESTDRANWYADAQGFALNGQNGGYPFPDTNPTTTSGGSGGYAPAGIDQATYNFLMSKYGGTKPKQWTPQSYSAPQAYQYQDLRLDDRGPFDTSQYDIAQTGLDEGFDDAFTRGGSAFDRSSAEIAEYENPYAQGMRQRTPGIDPALQQSMSAWAGAGSEAAETERQFGIGMDQGMDSVYDLLRRSEDSYTQGLQRGIAGDRMEFDQRLGGEQRMMNSDLGRRRAKAMQAWTDAQNDRNDQVAFSNNAGQNQAGQYNTQAYNDFMNANTGIQNQAGQYNNESINQYNSEAYTALMNLVLGGVNGGGQQTITDLTGGGAASGIMA